MLKLYNTLSRQIEEFKPMSPPGVGLYTCGPTVYNYPHIGNYRSYLFADTLKRYLKYAGYEVKHVMNLTDVDDKTIRDSQKAGKSLEDFTQFYSKEFFRDLEDLNIEPADIYPKATEHIPEMVNIINTLVDKHCAYKSTDGSIYFDIEKFNNYGQLAHLKKDELKEGGSERIKTDDYTKDNVQDFALWKAWDKNDGDVFWENELGKGRPGWHIECSAMSMKYLGPSFDIHTGGIDLIFPHHENEIAQSECATGKPFVKYWMHNGWLMVDGKKMSKSLNNFYTLRDIEKKGFSPLVYRYLVLQNHYRTPLNFTWDSLGAAQNGLEHLQSKYLELGEKTGLIDQEYKNKFRQAMDNDLETPQALAFVWDLLKNQAVSNADKKATILDFNKVLGLGLSKLKEIEISAEIQKLIDEREIARQNKDFQKSDELRQQINNLGFEIKDTSVGPKISRL